MRGKRGVRITLFFAGKEICGVYDKKNKIYYFSVVDIISVLSNIRKPKRKWTDLKVRLKNKNYKLYRRCKLLKIKSLDGRMRHRDVYSINAILILLKYIKSSKKNDLKNVLLEFNNIIIKE